MLRLLLCCFLMLGLTSLAHAQTAKINGGGTVRLQGNGTLTVAHNLTVTGTLDASTGTTLAFTGNGTQTFTAAPGQTIRSLIVNKPTGDLTLKNNINVSTELRVTKGDLNLNGFTIDLGGAGILRETSGNTVTGTSGTITARRILNAPSADNVAGLGAEITFAKDLGITQVTRGHTAQTSGGNQGIARYFDITPTNNANLNATLIFHYDDDELGGALELDLRLFRSTNGGASWSEEGGLPNHTTNTVTLSNIDAFSRWTLAGTGLLPVELTAFEALVDGEAVLLTWQTASETNNAGFEVQVRERGSANGEEGDWGVLAFVDGHGTTLEPQSYTHRVEARTPGRHVFRLKQLDYDGAFEYSPEVEVAVELPGAYLLTAPYPNPFNPQTQFSLMVKRRQEVEVSVYDALGRWVATLYRGMMEAEQARSLVFEAGALPSGLYLIHAVGEAFVATRKVMLVR